MSTRKKWEIDRRTFLRGSGVTLALPLLEAMLPSLARAASNQPLKYVSIYIPNGLVAVDFDPNANYRLSQNVLNALGSARSETTTIRGLHSKTLGDFGQGTGNAHPDAWVPFINAGRVAKYIDGMSKTYDMFVADVAKGNRLDCLSITANYEDTVYLYDPVHMQHMSYRGPGNAVDAWTSPKDLFNSIFAGVKSSPQSPAPQPAADPTLTRRQSILHYVSGEITALKAKVGTDDRLHLDEYFTGLEELERKIESQLPQMPSGGSSASCEVPTGIQDSSSYPDRLAMFYDIVYHALLCDITRVASIMHAMEGSHLNHKPFVPGIQNAEANWHGMSHLTPNYEGTSGDNNVNRSDLEKIHAWHFQQIGKFITRVKNTQLPSGGSLLDQMLITWGSSISHGGGHHNYGIMNCYAGTAGGYLKKNTDFSAGGGNISNLWLTYAKAMGAKIGSIGDSNGTFDSLRA